MLSERTHEDALEFLKSGRKVIVADERRKVAVPMEDYIRDPMVHFLVEILDEPEVEDEYIVEDQEPSRAEKRHKIESLAASHPEMSIREIAEEVGVAPNTVRKWIK